MMGCPVRAGGRGFERMENTMAPVISCQVSDGENYLFTRDSEHPMELGLV